MRGIVIIAGMLLLACCDLILTYIETDGTTRGSRIPLGAYVLMPVAFTIGLILGLKLVRKCERLRDRLFKTRSRDTNRNTAILGAFLVVGLALFLDAGCGLFPGYRIVGYLAGFGLVCGGMLGYKEV